MHHQNSLGRQISHEGLTTLGGWEEDKRPPSIAQMALNRKQIPFRRGGGHLQAWHQGRIGVNDWNPERILQNNAYILGKGTLLFHGDCHVRFFDKACGDKKPAV